MSEPMLGTERHRTSGERLLAKVRELVQEGNVRRIIIRNEDGRTLIEAPLTIGVLGAILTPVWAAIGAIAALVTDCSIEVERDNLHALQIPSRSAASGGDDPATGSRGSDPPGRADPDGRRSER